MVQPIFLGFSALHKTDLRRAIVNLTISFGVSAAVLCFCKRTTMALIRGLAHLTDFLLRSIEPRGISFCERDR